MHYANGIKAQSMDVVYMKRNYANGPEYVGILIQGNAQATTCNGQVRPVLERWLSDSGETPWLPSPSNSTTFCCTVAELMPVAMPEFPPPDDP